MRAWAGLAAALAVVACGDGSRRTPPVGGPRDIEDPPIAAEPPVTLGAWRFHGPPQGVVGDVQDVSPDEGGNVWVAAGDRVLVRPAGERDFDAFGVAFDHYDSTNSAGNRALTEAHALYRNLGYREIERYNDNPYAHFWFGKVL